MDKTTLPLPLAANFALWTVLAILAGFAGLLNLLDPSANLVRGHAFLFVSLFSFGYVAGTVLLRKEAPFLGIAAQLGAIGIGVAYYVPAGNPFGWALIATGLWGIGTLYRYRELLA